jgi:hypothetical protein
MVRVILPLQEDLSRRAFLPLGPSPACVLDRVLPPAFVLWAKLNETDVYRPLDKLAPEKRRHIVTLQFNDSDQREVDEWLRDCLAQFGLKDGRLPWRKDKTSTGSPALFASCDGNARPEVVDVNANHVSPTTRIDQGSEIKAYVTALKYAGFGGGLSIRVNSYQILTLAARSHPFKRAV